MKKHTHRRLASRTAGTVAVVVGIPSVLTLFAAEAHPAPQPARRQRTASMAECARRVRERPRDLEAYRCFHRAARARGQWVSARRNLEALVAGKRHNPAAGLVLGLLALDRGWAKPEPLLRAAAGGFRVWRHSVGEVHARRALARALIRGARLAAAAHELRQAREVVRAAAKPNLLVAIEVEEARLAGAKADYGRALALLQLAQSAALSRDRPELQAEIHGGLGDTLRLLGRNRGAVTAYRRQLSLLRSAGDRFAESEPLFGIFLARAGMGLSQKQLLPRLREALELARRAGNLHVEARLRLCLGQARSLARRARIGETQRALAILRRLGYVERILFATRQLAILRLGAGRDPGAAFELARDAVGRARAAGLPFHIARGLLVLAQMRWKFGLRERAIEVSLQALDAIERVRDRQRRLPIRARINSEWAYFYYRFAGYLLQGGPRPGPSRRDLELAFRVGERLRARVLLEALHASWRKDRLGATVRRLRDARRGVLARITGLQQALLEKASDSRTRRSQLGELDRLEARLSALEEGVARSTPLHSDRTLPGAPTLREVQRALAPDQAMVVFHFRGDPWYPWTSQAFVLTRDLAKAYPLEDARVLEKAVSLFPTALARRDGAYLPGAVRLYRELLRRPLGQLGPQIRRLVLIPDGVLHRLPFAALREAPGAIALGARYQVTLTPSATLWLRWKQSRTRPAQALLAFADPDPPQGGGSPARPGSAPWLSGVPRAPLPHGRAEARQAARMIGGASKVLFGSGASEAKLKKVRLNRYGLLHFATHSVLDETHPERSAVVLSPGGPAEDGLLQAREIANLELHGQVVVLSACRSTSGAVLVGEGVLSLARAFFEAGAHAVLANLWAARDDESRVLVSAFYRHLGRGRSVAQALFEARRERIAAGAPPAAWASLILIGRGDIVPLPGGRRPHRPGSTWPVVLLLGAALLLGATGVARWRRRRSCRS